MESTDEFIDISLGVQLWSKWNYIINIWCQPIDSSILKSPYQAEVVKSRDPPQHHRHLLHWLRLRPARRPWLYPCHARPQRSQLQPHHPRPRCPSSTRNTTHIILKLHGSHWHRIYISEHHRRRLYWWHIRSTLIWWLRRRSRASGYQPIDSRYRPFQRRPCHQCPPPPESESASRLLVYFGVLNDNLIKWLISFVKCISKF
jgi:hypothetical protein